MTLGRQPAGMDAAAATDVQDPSRGRGQVPAQQHPGVDQFQRGPGGEPVVSAFSPGMALTMIAAVSFLATGILVLSGITRIRDLSGD